MTTTSLPGPAWVPPPSFGHSRGSSQLMGVDMNMFKTVRSLACLAAMVLATQVHPLTAQIRGNDVQGPLEPHPAADEAIARIKSPY